MTRLYLLYSCKKVMHVNDVLQLSKKGAMLLVLGIAEFTLLQGITKQLMSVCYLQWPDMEERSMNRRTRKT
jgi:hypothetical protein